MIVNPHDIKAFIRRFACGDETVERLLLWALETPFRNNTDSKLTLDHDADIDFQSRKAKRAFKRAVKDGRAFQFVPTKELVTFTQDYAQWLTNFVDSVGEDTIEQILPNLKRRLQNLQTMDRAATLRRQGVPMTPEEIEFSISRQQKDRNKKNIETVAVIEDDKKRITYKLMRLLTPQALVRGGEKAQNCLGFNFIPNRRENHKQSVLKPHQWLYFQITDTQDQVFATIILNVQKGTLAVTGNENKPLTEAQDDIVFHFIDEIAKLVPHAVENYRPKYGTQARCYSWRQTP